MAGDLALDLPSLAAAEDAVVRGVLGAASNAVRGTTKALERRLEAATRDAVPGKLWRAWKSETFPRRGIAREPAGTVFLNGRNRTQGALAFFTEQGAIRGSRGQYLAIPLPTAGPRGRLRDLTPGEWERRHPGVRLQFIYRADKPSLLVAVGGTTNAASGAYRKLTKGARGRLAQGRAGANPQADAVVPIFVLLPVVRFRGGLSIAPIIAASEGELTSQFFQEVRKLKGG